MIAIVIIFSTIPCWLSDTLKDPHESIRLPLYIVYTYIFSSPTIYYWTKLRSAFLRTVKPIYWHQVMVKERAAFILRVPIQGEWVAPALKPWTPQWFSAKSFYRHNLGEGCRVCGFLLTGWWWDNWVVLQESWVQPEVTSWVGALVPAEELNDIVMYIPWGRTRTLPQGCTVVAWLLLPCFCICSLPGFGFLFVCLYIGGLQGS